MLEKMVPELFFAFTLSLVSNIHLCQCDHGSLKLVVAIFRHGERTADSNSTYPNDPHINETYEPYGPGQLTNLGKINLYGLGQAFRQMYDSFLGPLYVTNQLNALCTNFTRTKASLQLFLAGLFPPYDTSLEWNRFLNWNPIDYNYVSPAQNRLLSFPMVYCPKYQRLLDEYLQSSEATTMDNFYKPLYPYVSKHSGLNISSIDNLYDLYLGIAAQHEWGLKLPKWTDFLYPTYLARAVEDDYKLFTATSELNQLFGGFLIKKTINDMLQKLNDSSNPMKMYVYSGHELNVAATLAALKVFYPHIPKYGSCIIIELHKVKDTAYVKVRYNPKVSHQFFDLTIPGCTTVCPLEDFVRLLADHLPEDGDPCIEKHSKK